MNNFISLIKNKQGILGMIMIGLIVLCAIFAPVIAPKDPIDTEVSKRFINSSSEFLLGTDQLGRCVLSRLIFGARYSLGIAFIVLLITSFVSVFFGTVFSYYGGILDRIFVGICDVFMAFPPLALILALVGILGPGTLNLIVSIVLAMWVWYAKIVRSYVLMEKNKNYVMSAKVAGSSDLKIIFRHILPNITPPLVVFFSLGIGDIILMISGFSFLGLGIESGTPEWGSMLSEAKKFIYTQPHFMFYPGLCIFFTVCGFNVFGEALRDVLSPDEV